MVRGLKLMRFKVKETNKQSSRKRKTNQQLGTKDRMNNTKEWLQVNRDVN